VSGAEYRTGLGWDVHRIGPGRPLILGGVPVAAEFGLEGHSDADVLAHAITDAILGAAALGDIGMHFPDTDPRWKGADSAVFLERAQDLARDRGLVIGNIDAIVIAEAPKIAPHAKEVRERIAEILGIDVDDVSVRGTSTNGLGFPGRKEGLAAMAVVLLTRQE
jgi:2-C-methyl-D-erythritol 2,4-cyclodiphosphate synthase